MTYTLNTPSAHHAPASADWKVAFRLNCVDLNPEFAAATVSEPSDRPSNWMFAHQPLVRTLASLAVDRAVLASSHGERKSVTWDDLSAVATELTLDDIAEPRTMFDWAAFMTTFVRRAVAHSLRTQMAIVRAQSAMRRVPRSEA